MANKIIVVDAGHGGADPGAIRGNYQEKDITLAGQPETADYLSQAGPVTMLREDDRDLAPNQQAWLRETGRSKTAG